MCEVPSNVVLADEFLKVFDGYSIGSNDLSRSCFWASIGIQEPSRGFSMNGMDAVHQMIAQAIRSAKRAGKPIGICGQAPSDFPEFAEWLVREGIDSISLNPDDAIATTLHVAAAEGGRSV
jgi:pyruvate,water dikinase